jgi:hypothetical protein
MLSEEMERHGKDKKDITWKPELLDGDIRLVCVGKLVDSKRDSSSKEDNGDTYNDPDHNTVSELNKCPHFLSQTRDNLLNDSTDSSSDYVSDSCSCYLNRDGDSSNLPAASGSTAYEGDIHVKAGKKCCQAVTMDQE